MFRAAGMTEYTGRIGNDVEFLLLKIWRGAKASKTVREDLCIPDTAFLLTI